ncbi:TIGR04141 family sporadically distributed protein [Chromobacterium phragmitis]|uniref:Sporadically distributed protein, TIGR04141 family n=1 Tax=Chromobacterium phragmitis TaxID=2202141 RepID=A0A344UHY5_9NEIS|nr:TIGR04141 family sporadically distributed protein [Chromobacterium phragmitis]AXE34883.1 hypothetical protein DK843_11600 [Chromobacterium phragmitis]
MKKSHVESKYKLTVFLIKNSYTDIDTFINAIGFETIDIKEDGEELGKLIYKGGFKSEPSWVSIFKGQEGFDSSSIFNLSSKAIFLHQHANRWFCFTFGYARHLIDEHAYERNFGLITALNIGDPSAITSIDKTNISHISLHSKEQATKEIELTSFEFNDETDILKSITAKVPKNESIKDEETLSGRDSVTIYTRASIKKFPAIAERLYCAFNDNKYKERYPWLDKIIEERDSTTIEELDSTLIAYIIRGNFEKVWLAIPEVISWEEIDGFTFKEGQNKSHSLRIYPELDISDWINQLRDKNTLSISQLKLKRICAHRIDNGPSYKWSVYRCLNAEIDLNEKKYILNDGSWYNIEHNFVQEVNNYFSTIPDSDIYLPPYHSKTEPEYLRSIADEDSRYALMDQNNIMIGGKLSRIEFCDLYSKEKEIIHVKKYSGSSVLSHLFSQALVSAECLLHDIKFRKDVNELLPMDFRLPSPEGRLDPSQYSICIAIMCKYSGPLDIPFFSKVSFKNAAVSLKRLGFNVFKLKINKT